MGGCHAESLSVTPSIKLIQIYLYKTAHMLYYCLCISDSQSFICCGSLSLPPVFSSHITLSTHLLFVSSRTVQSFFFSLFHLFSTPSLSSHAYPTSSPAAGELKTARRRGLSQMVNIVACRCLSCSHCPPHPSPLLLPASSSSFQTPRPYVQPPPSQHQTQFFSWFPLAIIC